MRIRVVGFPPHRPSAGMKALWVLARLCRERGVDALVLMGSDVIPDSEAFYILPEIMPSFGARFEWRWMLSPEKEPPSDYVWDKVFDIGDVPELRVPVMDHEAFHPGKGEVRKGLLSWWAEGTPATSITYDWPQTPALLGYALRHAEYLVSGRDTTLLTAEARMCGCPVLSLVPREEFHDRFKDCGIAYSLEELDQARETVKQFPAYYAVYEHECNALIDSFISDMFAHELGNIPMQKLMFAKEE